MASDLDGTLLTSDRLVTDRTVAAVERVRAAGARFVVVTGRPVRWLTSVVERLGDDEVMIAQNGAVVWHPATNEVLASHPLELDLITSLVAQLAEDDPELGWAVERPLDYARTPNFATLLSDDGVEVAPIEALLDRPLTKLLARAERFDPRRFERIRALVGDAAEVSHSGNDALIEIAAPGVHKAATLATLATDWGVAAEDVIAFGDQVNDEQMLAWAGRGVAMGNAAPHVRRMADEVTGTNDEGGVARVLEREFPGE
ncbi:MAG: Cof-type HAD-IIB family hydrolase [Microthrixaceae bacterium]